MNDWLELIKLLLAIALGALFIVGFAVLCLVFWLLVGLLIAHAIGYPIYYITKELWHKLRGKGKRIRESNSAN